jgi:hypothetical protein
MRRRLDGLSMPFIVLYTYLTTLHHSSFNISVKMAASLGEGCNVESGELSIKLGFAIFILIKRGATRKQRLHEWSRMREIRMRKA